MRNRSITAADWTDIGTLSSPAFARLERSGNGNNT
jgi:hypothetical protein